MVHKNDSGSSLFIVIKGALEVLADGAIVGGIQEGSFFGEMSLLTGEPRRATVRATSEVWLAEVTKELLEPILVSNPSVLEKLSSILAEREAGTILSQTTSDDSAATPLHREDYLQRLKLFFRM